MLAPPCYIFSDAHLGAASTALERCVVSFLKHLPSRAGSLLINGDLFDFWFEWRHVMPRGHFRVLAALAELRDAGTPVLMIGGNHDCWGGEILTRDVGIEFQLGAWDGSLGGWRAHVEHGDGLRPVEDRAYRRLRHVLRNRLAIRAFRALHPDWASAVASGSSDASRAHRAPDEGAGLQRVAIEQLEAHPETELVVFGHSHVPALERARTGGVYANPGAWMDAPTFLVVTPERVELRRWSESAEGDLLHALDRRS
ncbi:MAG TPA: UDP-2,3-diacylglucosamine diphosphatase [Gemmatimonadaceae bacterium]|nr:UDP-2,3-diacylglucosamine diphosphatase [Gemmatimonadaceae bacterium]